MKLRTFMLGAAALVVFGWLGFRVVDLERRVAHLSEQLGSPTPSEAPTAANAEHVTVVSAAPQGYEQRLHALEDRLDKLASAQSSLARMTGKDGHAEADNQILSVIEREGNRIRDVQIEYHRPRWIEARGAQLESFAKATHMTTQQTQILKGVLEQEIDDLITVLKKPDLMEDPDGASAAWQSALDKTNETAHTLLTPPQAALWDQARQFERQLLWPWLPPKSDKGQP
jgi:hypothetical protein